MWVTVGIAKSLSPCLVSGGRPVSRSSEGVSRLVEQVIAFCLSHVLMSNWNLNTAASWFWLPSWWDTITPRPQQPQSSPARHGEDEVIRFKILHVKFANIYLSWKRRYVLKINNCSNKFSPCLLLSVCRRRIKPYPSSGMRLVFQGSITGTA